jgi:protein phosphatase 1 regulatory subunit 7
MAEKSEDKQQPQDIPSDDNSDEESQPIEREPASDVPMLKVHVDIAALEINLTHSKLTEIPAVVGELKSVEVLTLRQNLIKKLDLLSGLLTLRELDVYDNEVETIHAVDHLTGLESLDMSFNRIRVVEKLNPLVNLRELFLIQNKISKIAGLDYLRNLTMLELGSNRIRVRTCVVGYTVCV